MKRAVVLLFLLIVATASFGCDCAPPRPDAEAKIIEFREAEVVALVEILESSDSTSGWFRAKVIESFKGPLSHDDFFEGGFNIYCFPYVKGPGKWLIYGIFENSIVQLILCGRSRDIDKPEDNSNYGSPPPPPWPNRKLTEKERAILRDSIHTAGVTHAKLAVATELAELRASAYSVHSANTGSDNGLILLTLFLLALLIVAVIWPEVKDLL